MTGLGRALVEALGPDDLAALAERLAPYLPERERTATPTDWLTLRQAATHLGIGYSTAKRHAAEGVWPVEREGGRVYVRAW